MGQELERGTNEFHQVCSVQGEHGYPGGGHTEAVYHLLLERKLALLRPIFLLSMLSSSPHLEGGDGPVGQQPARRAASLRLCR